jgi:Domain of unknown function (DUF4304)
MAVYDGLASVLEAALRPLGFRRRRSSWYRKGDVVYAIVNIQKSSFDETCYINIGFCPVGQIGGEWAPESKCPIRLRLGALRAVSVADAALLDPASLEQLGDADWRAAVAERIGSPLVDVVGAVDSLDDLRRFVQTEVSERLFVHRQMQEFLRA